MSELREFECRIYWPVEQGVDEVDDTDLFYLKSEADKVIADLEESHKKEVGQLLMEIVEMKNRIAPKQSDKTLQERLDEVCEKHGVSTLQDLDWAFCESEKGRARDFIEAIKAIAHHKYKRCLAMARWCDDKSVSLYSIVENDLWKYTSRYWLRWRNKWLKLAEKFKESK